MKITIEKTLQRRENTNNTRLERGRREKIKDQRSKDKRRKKVGLPELDFEKKGSWAGWVWSRQEERESPPTNIPFPPLSLSTIIMARARHSVSVYEAVASGFRSTVATTRLPHWHDSLVVPASLGRCQGLSKLFKPVQGLSRALPLPVQ